MTFFDLFPGSTGPGVTSADSPVALGIEWYLTAPAWLAGYRFWRADTATTGPIPGRTYRVVDASSGTAVDDTDAVFALSGTGWQQVLLPVPIAVDTGVPYRTVLHFPNGYSATGGYFLSGAGVGGIVNGPLSAPDVTLATGGDQCSAKYGGGLAFTDGSFGGGLYWLSPVLTDVDPGGGGPVELDGVATAAAAATGQLGVARGLTGSATAAADVDGVLGVRRGLSATSAAAGSATASLTVVRPGDDGVDTRITAGRLRTGWSTGRVRTAWRAGRVI